ncbi:MAG: hypothetical protein JW881_19140 [Spirochaetales bacterium]|nr:hypothetical protein [Spirochaetales bacterium]
MTGVTTPAGETAGYTYNNAGELLAVPGYTADTAEPVTYNTRGLLETITAANGVETSYAFDTNNRLTHLDHTHGEDHSGW